MGRRRRCDPARLRQDPHGSQRPHTGAERTNARKHNTAGIADQPTIGGEPGVGTNMTKALVRRVQIADAIVEHS